jgi:phage gp45-like
MTNNGRLIAQNGTYIVNDTTEYVANAEAYYMAEDTVIARIEINGDTVTDVKANYISTPATAVKGGVLLTPQGDDYFSAITLTSGSVTVILK